MPTQAERFASCVKNVVKTFKTRKLKTKTKKRLTAADKEGIAVAICTKSILWPQGRTIKRFYMKDEKPNLVTQKRKTKL